MSDALGAPGTPRPRRLCLTGGIACGKSLAGEFLAAMGIPVIDADDVCHRLMAAGTPVFAEVLAAFGPEILGPDGAIDRAALGRRVFRDPDARLRLNALVHPAARRAVEAWADAHPPVFEAGGGRLGGVAIVPLVYEAGWTESWDGMICVGAPVALQRERLRRKGLSDPETDARLAAQWPVEDKMSRADYVVFNAGTVACARRQIERVVERIREQMEKGYGR